MFTDSHCHIFKEYFDDIDKIVNNAKNNGVMKMINDADNVKSCYEVIETSNNYDNIYFTLGVHPEDCNDDISEVEKLVDMNKDNKKLVAIGEIGLDYYYGKDTRDKQIEIFRMQLDIAKKYHLPVIVHSREATKDTIDILKEYPEVRGDIHCFSGSFETAKEYLKMGYYIGVGGVMTFKNAKIGEVIKEIPLDRLLLETDSPYLAPTPLRGTTNESANIKIIAEYLANLKGISLEEVSKQTEKNVNDLFLI